MSDYLNKMITVESVLKSEPSIRHLLDVSCPLYKKDKSKINGVLIVCKSFAVRKFIVSLIKDKLELDSFKTIDLNLRASESDMLSRITQLQPKDCLLCEEPELKFSNSVRKSLSRILEDNSCDIHIGRGSEAKTIEIELPEITYIFSCEQKSSTTDFLSMYCEHVIDLNDFYIKEICEPLIAALLNEEHIEWSTEVIKSICIKNNKNVDLCLRSVRRIIQYFELNEAVDRNITRVILEDIEGRIYYNFTVEYIRELRRIDMTVQKIVRWFEQSKEEFREIDHAESMQLLIEMRNLLEETTQKLRSLPSSDLFN